MRKLFALFSFLLALFLAPGLTLANASTDKKDLNFESTKTATTIPFQATNQDPLHLQHRSFKTYAQHRANHRANHRHTKAYKHAFKQRYKTARAPGIHCPCCRHKQHHKHKAKHAPLHPAYLHKLPRHRVPIHRALHHRKRHKVNRHKHKAKQPPSGPLWLPHLQGTPSSK